MKNNMTEQTQMNNAPAVPEEWIISYASGSISSGHALLMASHASYHTDVQSKIQTAEAVGGEFLEQSKRTKVSDHVLDNLLDQIADTEQDNDLLDRDIPAIHNLPKPLAEYLGCSLDELKWRFMGPGMKNCLLWKGPDDERVWLLKARGGSKMPEHGHNGEEMTLVLQGGFSCGADHYGVGDMEIADTPDEHQPIIDAGQDCICLVLTKGPIRMKGVIAKMIQPLIGL